ncbi:MAG: hypothetical protein EOP84_24485 [Verrucomicrobiaceae bacterium]|nr:MAG: hypothetical protein EOP84_24485 [Verrucomicrobiaceae bacterium]
MSRLEALEAAQRKLSPDLLESLNIDRDELVTRLQRSISPAVSALLEQRFSIDAKDGARAAQIRAVFADAHRRLLLEIETLGRRGNINLVVGVFTTILAAAMLAYMVFNSTFQGTTLVEILAHYIPRVTVIVFIEVFSFFFLRLYKSTLGEIRSYQDDLTWLNIQQVAVEAAWSASDTSKAALSKDLLANAKRAGAPSQKAGDIDPGAMADLMERFAKLVIKSDKAK